MIVTSPPLPSSNKKSFQWCSVYISIGLETFAVLQTMIVTVSEQEGLCGLINLDTNKHCVNSRRTCLHVICFLRIESIYFHFLFFRKSVICLIIFIVTAVCFSYSINFPFLVRLFLGYSEVISSSSGASAFLGMRTTCKNVDRNSLWFTMCPQTTNYHELLKAKTN